MDDGEVFFDLPLRTATLYPVARRFPLHALPIACGHSVETGQGYRWDGMKRGKSEFAVLQYTVEGEGALVYEGEYTALVPGTLMLVTIPHDHVYRLPETSPSWRFLFVTATGSEFLRIAHGILKVHGPVLTLGGDSRTVRSLARLIEDAFHDMEIRSPFALSAQIYGLAMTLLDELTPEGGTEDLPQWIDRVRNYCRERLGESPDIGELAGISGLSRYHFTREFSRYLGTSPRRYLEHLRIRTATRLLHDSDLTVKEITARCGFHDVNYFCRVFRRLTGLSPGAYRSSGM